MVYPVHNFRAFKVIGIDPFNTGDVETVLIRITAALVMGVYPAGFAKVVFGGVCAPLVERKIVTSLDDFQTGEGGSANIGTAPLAE